MKRKLTREEKNCGVLFLDTWFLHLPPSSAIYARDQLRKKIMDQLDLVEIYPEMIDPFFKELESKCRPVAYGKNVGHIAGQSIGEFSTQTNLNSIDGKEKVRLSTSPDGSAPFEIQIGEFIDLYIKDTHSYSSSTFIHQDMFIESVDLGGNFLWDRITAVTRHRVPENGMVQVKTASKRSVEATKGLSFLVWKEGCLVPTKGSDLELGDYLPLLSLREVEDERDEYKSFNDILMDPIVQVADIPSPEWVYDFTVEKTKNFCISNGLCVRDTFHKAGVQVVDLEAGVPRFLELIHTNQIKAQNNPSCVVYPRVPCASLEDIEILLLKKLEYTIFNSLVDSFSIISLGEWEEKTPWRENWRAIYENGEEHKTNDDSLVLRFFLNKTKLYRLKLSLEDIYISDEEVTCISFSPLFMGIIDFLSSEDTLSEDYRKIVDHHLCGIEGINKVYFLQENGLWRAETQGSAFEKILQLREIDETKSCTNNIWEIYHLYGVEFTREYLFQEMKQLLENINWAHYAMIVERMLMSGHLRSFTRYTRKNEENSILSKITFEETFSIFLKACVNNELEPMLSNSASIICAKIAPTGTGKMELLFEVEEEEEDYKETKHSIQNAENSTYLSI